MVNLLFFGIYCFEEYSTSNFVRWYMFLNTEFLKDNEIQLILEKTGFFIDKIYDYDRPTVLKDGEQVLVNWMK